jgi:hypothetical protein
MEACVPLGHMVSETNSMGTMNGFPSDEERHRPLASEGIERVFIVDVRNKRLGHIDPIIIVLEKKKWNVNKIVWCDVIKDSF